MQPGRMFRHGFGLDLGLLHKREPQTDLSGLPASIGNPTATLPQSIAATGFTADPTATDAIVTASAQPPLTTITQTFLDTITTDGVASTITSERAKTVVDPTEYASLTSAAAQSRSSTLATSASRTSAAATSSAAASKSSSNLSTLVPAIVVPLVVVLLASLGVFWFVMRRRAMRELKSQPEFVMAGKGEKLSSRSNSSRSNTSDSWAMEKKSPAVTQNELPSTKSPPSANSEWLSSQVGIARPLDLKEATASGSSRAFEQPRSASALADRRPPRNFSGPGSRPATAGRSGPPPSNRDRDYRNRSNSSPGQRGPSAPSRPDPSPVLRGAPSPALRNGPSPVPQWPGPNGSQGLSSNPRGHSGTASAALRLRDPSPSMNHNTRAQAPSRLEATGAYNGQSSISQYSPIVKETPGISSNALGAKRAPPPPLKTSELSKNGSKSPSSASPQGGVLTEENLRIARFANSSRLGYTPGEPSPSPKLPPPATRSQLIPRESPKEERERFFGGISATHSRDASISRQHSLAKSDRASVISGPDDYEDIDAKSDISSLNEFERFDFGDGIGSRLGSAAAGSLNFFAATNSPASGRGSPFGNVATHERW